MVVIKYSHLIYIIYYVSIKFSICITSSLINANEPVIHEKDENLLSSYLNDSQDIDSHLNLIKCTPYELCPLESRKSTTIQSKISFHKSQICLPMSHQTHINQLTSPQITSMKQSDSKIKNNTIWNGFPDGFSSSGKTQTKQAILFPDERIVIAVVCCGTRVYEAINMMKSAIALSTSPLTIELFTEENLIIYFTTWILEWQSEIGDRVRINIRLAEYPQEANSDEWRYMFTLCSSFRLFMPVLLPDVDSLIYLDSDIVLLGRLENLWLHFRNMTSSQMVGMVKENEIPEIGWYNRFANHPYYGDFGLNAGVILMNLTRMRQFNWTEHSIRIQAEFRSVIEYGDQDIINIMMHYYPEKLHLIGCEYNYRSDHCKTPINNCKTAEYNGVYLLHGNRQVFHTDANPVFKLSYEAWDQFNLRTSLLEDLKNSLSSRLLKLRTEGCGKMYQFLLQNIENELLS